MLSVRFGNSGICTFCIVDLYVCIAKDADEKEKWILALENAISRQDLNQVCSYTIGTGDNHTAHWLCKYKQFLYFVLFSSSACVVCYIIQCVCC